MSQKIMDYNEKILVQTFNDYKSHVMKCVNRVSVLKDSKLSEEARNKGNDLFRRGVHNKDTHQRILQCYSKSLALAPLNSKQQAFAYGNRSSLLFHLEKYNECIQDIDRALKITNCMQLKIKLLCRKIKCLKILEKPFEEIMKQCESYSQEVDSKDANKSQVLKLIEETKLFQSENISKSADSEDLFAKNLENIPENCINQFDHISIACNEKYGRHLIANRDFKPGEVVYIEDFYTASFFEEKAHLSCAHCFQICWTGIPCHQCSEVMYCSEKCKEESWTQFHEIECAILPVIKLGQSNKLEATYNQLRILIMGVKEFGSIAKLKDELKQLANATDFSPDQFLKDGSKIRQTIKNIYILQSKGSYTNGVYRSFGLAALEILFCLIKYSSFFGENHSLEKIDDLMKDEDILFTGNLLVKLCMIHGINVHRIDMGDADSVEFDCEFTGVLLPILSSLMNHSCFPNVYKTYASNKKMIVCALQPIEKGSQLFESYKDCMVGYAPRVERHHMLSTSDFTCDCLACSENWPTYEELIVTEEMHLRNFRDSIIQECMDIMMVAKTGYTRNFTYDDVEVISKHMCTSFKKFKPPCSASIMLLDVLQNIIVRMYFLRPKTTIYGKCVLMKSIL